MNPQDQQPGSYNQFPQPATPSGPSNKSKKTLIIASGVAAALLLLGGITIALTAGGKDEPSSSRNTSTNPRSTPSEREPAKDTEPVTTLKQTEVVLNKLVATDLGQTITATKMIRGYADSDLEENEEGVLIEVRVESDGTYTSVTGKSGFRLIGDDGKENRTAYLITEAELTQAGFTPLTTSSVKKGAPVTGYLAFTVPKGSKKLTFRYHRNATQILGGEKVPEKDFDVVLAP